MPAAIGKPKPNIVSKTADKLRSASPLPDWLNKAILPDPTADPDVTTFDVSGGLEPAVSAGVHAVAPLTSFFKSKLEREAATSEFLKSVQKFARLHMPGGTSNKWQQAAEDLAFERPRVAAHIRHAEAPSGGTSQYSSIGGGFTAAMNWHPLLQRKGPGELQVHKSAIDDLASNAEHAHSVMWHEANHAAQALGDPKSGLMYDLAHQQVGYNKNPYEISSVVSGGVGEMGLRARSAAPVHPYQQQEALIQHLKDKGISLDTSYGGGAQTMKFRKWGMPSDPENYIQRGSLDTVTERKLQALEKALKAQDQYRIPATRTKGFMTAPKAMDPILQKGMVNQPNLEGALLYLKHRRGEIDTDELTRRVADLQRRLGQKP